MRVTVEYNGRKYYYSRDAYGVGAWYPLNGFKAHVAVPLVLAADLMKEARRQGISESVFSKPKPKKERSIRVGTRKKSSPKRGQFSVSLSSIMKKISAGNIDSHDPVEE